jgi:hypothetical protein
MVSSGVPAFGADETGTGRPAASPQFTQSPTDSTYSAEAAARLYVRADAPDGGYLSYEWHRSQAYDAPQDKNNANIKTEGASTFSTGNEDDASLAADGTKSVLDFTTPAVDETTYYYYWVTVTNHFDSNGDGTISGTGETSERDSGLAEVKVVARTLFTSVRHGDFSYTNGNESPLTTYPPSQGYWNTTHYGTKILETNTANAYIGNGSNSRVAELSAVNESSIYQEVATVPGKIYEWSLDHAAKNNSLTTSYKDVPDVMAVLIGPAINAESDYMDMSVTDYWNKTSASASVGASSITTQGGSYNYGANVYTHFNAIVRQVLSKSEITAATYNADKGATFNDIDRTYSTVYGGMTYYVFISADLRDSNFVHRTGSYTVPAGQGTTVFGFISVSSPAGGASGNILDNITFASGTELEPQQEATYTGENSISTTTKAGFAYALAEVRGSSVNELTGLAATYDADGAGSGFSPVAVSPTAGLGSGGWYSSYGEGTPFTDTGILSFHDLTPGKTYRIIGIPEGAINEGLRTNMSPGAVLDNGYYRDAKLVPASGGADAALPSYSMELYGEGARQVRLTLLNTNAAVQYALLAEDPASVTENPEDARPLTDAPALAGTASEGGTEWSPGTGGDLAFENLRPATSYYLVARPAGYTEIGYADAAFDEAGTLAALRITTPEAEATDISPEAVFRDGGGTTITLAAEAAQPGYTYAVTDPATGAIVQSASSTGDALSFTNLDSARAYQLMASPAKGAWLPGVRVYPYPDVLLDKDYSASAVGAGTGGTDPVPANTEYQAYSQWQGQRAWLVGGEGEWASFTGTGRLELDDASVVAGARIEALLGGTFSTMSLFDALDELGASGNTALTVAYRAPADTAYTGPAVRPERTVSVPARPAAPGEESYRIDYAAETLISSAALAWLQPFSEAWTALESGTSVSFAELGWREATPRTVRLRLAADPGALRFASREATPTVGERPAAPAGLGTEVISEGTAITITGLEDELDYEYKTNTDNTWRALAYISSGEATLPYGEGIADYDIRYAATAEAPASFSIMVSSPLYVESLNLGQLVYGETFAATPLTIHNITDKPVTLEINAVTLLPDDGGFFILNGPTEPQTVGAYGENTAWTIEPHPLYVPLHARSFQPIIQVNYTVGEGDDAKPYTATSNAYLTVEKADWDISALTGEVTDISADGFTIKLTGGFPPGPISAYFSFSEASGSWKDEKDETSYTFTGLNAQSTYRAFVRARSDDNHNQSAAVSIAQTVHTAFATPSPQALLRMDYAGETVSFVSGVSPANYTLTLNGTTVANNASLSAAAEAGPVSLTLTRLTDGTYPASATSAPLVIAGKDAAPTGITTRNAADDTASNGRIEYAGSFQYRVSRNGANVTDGWRTASGSVDVTAGRYEVRIPPGESFASKIQSVTVGSDKPTVTVHTKTALTGDPDEKALPSYIALPSGSGWIASTDLARPGEYDHAYNVSPLALPAAASVTSRSHVFKGWYDTAGYDNGSFTGSPVTQAQTPGNAAPTNGEVFYAKWIVRPTVSAVATNGHAATLSADDTTASKGLASAEPAVLAVHLAPGESTLALGDLTLAGQSTAGGTAAARLYTNAGFSTELSDTQTIAWGARPTRLYLRTTSAEDNTTAVYYALDVYATRMVSFTAAQAGGTGGSPNVKTTTDLSLSFDEEVADLSADSITLTNGTGSAVKGELSGSGQDYSLAVSGVQGGTVTVSVADWAGYQVDNGGFTPHSTSIEVYRDGVAPEATINYDPRGAMGFLGGSSEDGTIEDPFGQLFFKGTVSVAVQATDEGGDGMERVFYQRSVQALSLAELLGKPDSFWLAGAEADKATFVLATAEKTILYVKLRDWAGNTSYYRDGIIIYHDSAAVTENISYTKLSGVDQPATVALNGNTVAEVRNGEVLLVPGTHYNVAGDTGDTLIFKAAYLENLAAGNYTLTVSYKPQGEAYTPDNRGSAGADLNTPPATTEIALNVDKASPEVTLKATPASSATYGTDNVTLTASVANAGAAPTGTVTFYADAGTGSPFAAGSALALSDAGTASVTVTLGAGNYPAIHAEYTGDTNYTGGSGALGSYTVSPASQSGLVIQEESETVSGTTVTRARETRTLALTAAGGQGAGAYSWQSSAPGVATITPSGDNATVSFVSAGTTTLTLTKAADNNYNVAFTSLTLQVSEETTPPVPGNDGRLTTSAPTEDTSGETPTWSIELLCTQASDENTFTDRYDLLYYVYAHASVSDDMESPKDCVEHGGEPVNEGGSRYLGGETASFTIEGLAPNTSYWFNVVVEDEAGNRAAYKATHVMTPVSVAVVDAVQTGGQDGTLASTGILVTFDYPVRGFLRANLAFELDAAIFQTDYAHAVDPAPDGSSATWLIPIRPESATGTPLANGTELVGALTVQSWSAEEGTLTHSYRIAGDSASEDITFFRPVPEATPDAYIDYLNRTIAGLIPFAWYSVGNTSEGIGHTPRQASDSGSYPINDTWLGEDIDIIKMAGTATVDSAAKVLEIPTRPAQPTVNVHNPTSSTDPSVVTVTNATADTAYEYRVGTTGEDGEPTYGDWLPVPDNITTDASVELSGYLSGGRYTIRVAAVAEEEGVVGSFSSPATAFYVHDYSEVRFDAKLQGYELTDPDLAAQTVHVAGTVASVTWTGSNLGSAPSWFTLDGSGNTWTIQPQSGLAPGLHEAEITTSYSDGTPAEQQPVIFTVHPKAEFAPDGVAVSDEDGDGVSDTMTLSFAYPIVGGLSWDEVVVNSAVVKKPGVTDFANAGETAGNTYYVIDIAPASSAVKTGDNASVVVRLDLNGKLDTYQKQNADQVVDGQSHNYISAVYPITVPRAIESARVMPSLEDYASNIIQFTLERPTEATEGLPVPIAFHPLLADTAEKGGIQDNGDSSPYTGPVVLTDKDGLSIPGLDIVAIYLVDADSEPRTEGSLQVKYTWTWRVFFTLDENLFTKSVSNARLSIPSFDIDAVTVTGDIVRGQRLAAPTYILDGGTGFNYLMDMEGFQVLPALSAASSYVAPALSLKTSADLGSSGNAVSIREVYLDSPGDGAGLISLAAANYTISSGGPNQFRFSDDPTHPTYLTDQLVFTLNEDWTRTNGSYRLAVVFSNNTLAQATFEVTGITPTYALTLDRGPGGSARPTAQSPYGIPANTQTSKGVFAEEAPVALAAAAPEAGWKFHSWTQTVDTAIPLPLSASGTISMPAEPVTLTATYTDGVAPVTTVNPVSGSWIQAGETIALSVTDFDVRAGDADGGIVDKTYYRIDDDALSTEYTVPFTLDMRSEGLHTIRYWSVDEAGNVEQAQEATIGYDTTAPAASVTVCGEVYDSFDITEGFTRFYKGAAPTLALSATDTRSGVATIEYLIHAENPKGSPLFADAGEAADDPVQTWEPWTAGSPTPTLPDFGTYRVYVRVTDSAGNTTAIRSEGIVYYEDSTPASATATFIRFGQSGVDVAPALTLNGNTVASVVNTSDGNHPLVLGTDYAIASSTLTLKPASTYLSSLVAREEPYTLCVSYAPRGVSFEGATGTGNDTPAQTLIELAIEKAGTKVSLSVEPAQGASYSTPVKLTARIVTSPSPDSTPAPKGTVTFYGGGDGTTLLGEEKVEDDPFDRAVLQTTSLGAGTHMLRAVYSGDADYTTSEGTLSPYSIAKAEQDPLAISLTEGGTAASLLTKTYGDAPFKLYPLGGSGTGTWEWRSANSSVAEVSADGTVTILATGSTNLYLERAESPNYNARRGDDVRISLSVERRPVELTYTPREAAPDTRVYDGTDTAPLNGSYTVAGLVPGDGGSLGISVGSAVFVDAGEVLATEVGTAKPVSFSGFALSGTKAPHYLLTDDQPRLRPEDDTPTVVTADITQRELTVSGIRAESKVYDGNTEADFNAEDALLKGIHATDSVALDTAAASASFTDAHAEEAKPVTFQGFALTGAHAHNYSLAPPAQAFADISPAEPVWTEGIIVASALRFGESLSNSTPHGAPLGVDVEDGPLTGSFVWEEADPVSCVPGVSTGHATSTDGFGKPYDVSRDGVYYAWALFTPDDSLYGQDYSASRVLAKLAVTASREVTQALGTEELAATNTIRPRVELGAENYPEWDLKRFYTAQAAVELALDPAAPPLSEGAAEALLAELQAAGAALAHDHPLLSNSAEGGINQTGIGVTIRIKGEHETLTRVTFNDEDTTLGIPAADGSRSLSLRGSSIGTVRSGSVIVELSPAFVDSLDNGNFNVAAHFDDGYRAGSGNASFAVARTPVTGDAGPAPENIPAPVDTGTAAAADTAATTTESAAVEPDSQASASAASEQNAGPALRDSVANTPEAEDDTANTGQVQEDTTAFLLVVVPLALLIAGAAIAAFVIFARKRQREGGSA